MDIISCALIVQFVHFGQQTCSLQCCIKAFVLIQLVPNHGVDENIRNIHSFGEGNHAALAVNRLALFVDQVEHVSNLCAVPGHLGHGEFLLNLDAIIVGVGNGSVFVGIVGTCRNFRTLRTQQIHKVLQRQFGGGQLINLTVHELAFFILLELEVGTFDLSDLAVSSGHMGARSAAGNTIDGMALQSAVSIECKVFQYSVIVSTLMGSGVQNIVHQLDVEFFQARCRVRIQMAGHREVDGVTRADLILDNDIGGSFQNFLCNVGEDFRHLRACVSIGDREEVGILLTQGSSTDSIRLGFLIGRTGDIVQQGRCQISTLGSATGPGIVLIEQANTHGVNGDTRFLHLGRVVLVLVVGITGSIVAGAGQHTGNGTGAGMGAVGSAVNVGIGGGNTIGHKHAELLALVTGAIGLSSGQNALSLSQTVIVGSTA